MPPHTVSIELRTTCDGCARPLPVNRLTPRVRCLACRADNPIVPESWDVLLHDALVADPDDAPATVALRHAGRAYQVRYAPGAAASGESRPRPDDLPDGVLVGLSAIIGEDPPDEARPETGPIPFVCPQCAGALTVDGKVRIVHCGFCGADTLLSDAVWARLHPSDGVRAWYLRIDGVQGAPEPLVWAGDAVAGPDGDVYVVTGPKAGVARVRLPDRARWKRADLPLRDPEEVRLVVDPSGDVWVAGPGGAEAVRLSAADGHTVETVGGPEPAGAKVHHFDLRRVQELMRLPDGWMLRAQHRLWRFDQGGRGVPTWPAPVGFFARWFGGGETLGPMAAHRATEASVFEAGGQSEHQPILTYASRWAAGPGGELYQAGMDVSGGFLAKFGPDGARRWIARLGEDEVPAASAPLPGPGGVWLLTLDDDRLYVRAFDDAGQPDRAPSWGAWRRGQWDGFPRLVRVGDGAVCWDVWGRVRVYQGANGVGNDAARATDRELAEE